MLLYDLEYFFVVLFTKPCSIRWSICVWESPTLGEALKRGSDVVGNRTKIKIVKNKVAPPFKQVEFDIMYGEGISNEGSIIDVGVELEIIRKSGAWYSYEGEKIGQGRDNAKEYLKANPETRAEIEEKIRQHSQAIGMLVEVQDDDDDDSFFE